MIRNKSLNLIILSALFMIISICQASAQKTSNVRIKGKLNNNNYKVIYLDKYSNQPEKIDSSAIINNTFDIKANIGEISFFDLRVADDKMIVLILKPGENVDITLDAANFQMPVSLSGSVQSGQIYDLNFKLKKYELKQDSLNQVYERNKDNVKKDSIINVLREAFDRFSEKEMQLIKKSILNNLTSMSGLLFISKLNANDNADIYSKYDSSLVKNYPNNNFVLEFHKQVAKNILLSIGHVAPEINEKDTTGKNIPLSSLRGKVVLIDFWASWCGPCRRESPHMVKLYNTYHDKGFEIYSVSLDKSKDAWIGAIKHDNLKWTHVSDLGYWGSKPAQLYNVSSIPFTVILDKMGKIVAKGLFGEEIDSRIEMLLK
jgi:thiol-disulfide isomerase/thioredoxin